MIDVVNKNGDQIDTQQLAKVLGCEIVTISALKQTGIQAASLAVKLAKQGAPCRRLIVSARKWKRRSTRSFLQLLAEIPFEMQRFYAIKLFERDDKITAMMNNVPDVEC